MHVGCTGSEAAQIRIWLARSDRSRSCSSRTLRRTLEFNVTYVLAFFWGLLSPLSIGGKAGSVNLGSAPTNNLHLYSCCKTNCLTRHLIVSYIWISLFLARLDPALPKVSNDSHLIKLLGILLDRDSFRANWNSSWESRLLKRCSHS